MRTLLLTSAVLLAACDRPAVDPTADPRQQAQHTRITGDVVVQSKARGNVVVLLFDAAHPPPPQGTGRPLSFALVPKETVFAHAADGDSGPFTAPYAFSPIAPGSYLIKGFIDANADFVPWYWATGDVDTGDVGGAAVDPVTFQPRVITVDASTPADGVAVSFSDAARVPVDRPVFQAGAAPLAHLGATPIQVTLSLQAITDGFIQQKQPVFLARFIDANGDGQPDMNADGSYAMWPRVIVRKTDQHDQNAPNPLVDENDLDHNGILDDTGADYDHVNPVNGATIPADGKPDLVVLAAGIDPSSFAMQLLDGMGNVKPTPTVVTELPVVVKPLALDASDPTAPVPLKTVPTGHYAVYVIQETGQVWRVPNELMPGVGAPLGLPEEGTQAFQIAVP